MKKIFNFISALILTLSLNVTSVFAATSTIDKAEISVDLSNGQSYEFIADKDDTENDGSVLASFFEIDYKSLSVLSGGTYDGYLALLESQKDIVKYYSYNETKTGLKVELLPDTEKDKTLFKVEYTGVDSKNNPKFKVTGTDSSNDGIKEISIANVENIVIDNGNGKNTLYVNLSIKVKYGNDKKEEKVEEKVEVQEEVKKAPTSTEELADTADNTMYYIEMLAIICLGLSAIIVKRKRLN